VAQFAAPGIPGIPAAIASQSLMDDDEDVPTTVALREHLEPLAAMMNDRAANGMRPAAGLPTMEAPKRPPPPPTQAMSAVGPSPASYAANAASYAANVGRPPGPTPGPTFGPTPGYQANAAPPAPGFGQNAPRPFGYDERTAAIPAPSDEGFGSTVALVMPDHAPGGPSFGQYGMPPAPPPPGGNGFGAFPQGGPAPSFGQPQANPALTPAGMVGGVPMNYPMAPQPGGPQSQIETALSLPRPDPAALWAAQQERQKGERRSVGVLIAVITLTVLCVAGIGAIVFFKIRARSQGDAPTPAVTATASAAAAPKPTATASAKK
jgi:hypothetical protein